MSDLAPITDPEAPDTLRIAVCGSCRNHRKEMCVTECVPKGLFHCLEPVTLDEWDTHPTFPLMKDLIELRAVTRLALVSLAGHYLREECLRFKKPLGAI